ncbi:MAG: class II aldolase/adducin family protein [Ignavibacteriales bacterium]|nr:MAG: class II aldolase/adducin family protein [Ignavibacteriaceae bacterium]MBW7873216.1 class II aldolase/adducin family protein [Ignavibacteria bacterium]MCZ2142858.1 class II aldolase/adducin family protein [Ignavibacteriales bacterium]OQY70980.1 MAG: hypothetical protein B6D45_10575 [Ignavibacteriales bacterium UTCHB3]MBV6443952.1 3-oxo-tetronate 4-phosphate decarboxylase [Ignavibacteriaceae bacterium]
MQEIDDLVKFSHLVYQKGFLAATDGNLSVRLPNGNILITRSGVCKGEVTADDLIEIDLEGKIIGSTEHATQIGSMALNGSTTLNRSTAIIRGAGAFGSTEILPNTEYANEKISAKTANSVGKKVSTESKLHLHIYRNRSDIKAVIHTHPIYSVICASSGISLDRPFFPEVILSIGRIPTCSYATPSTDELHHSLDKYLEYSNVFLLQNHGAVATGRNLSEAFYRTDKLEHTARIVVEAARTGGIKPLLRHQIDKLYQIAGSTYGISIHPKNRF